METSSSGVCRGGPLERRSSEELRHLLGRAVDASPKGIVITDPNVADNPIVYVNAAFEKATGYAMEEAIGRNCRFLQGEDRDQAALEELRVAIREGRECRVVLRNYRKDGAPFWNELYVSPVHDEEGHLINFVGVQNDVTESKRTEEMLRGSEDRLRLAVESTGLGTWDFNPLTGELKWDERCKEIFGLPPEAKVDDYETFLSRLHPNDRERTRRIVQHALDPNSGGEYNVEYRTVGFADGVERWVAAKGQAFFDPSGRAVRFIGTVLDITERKRAEEERHLLLAREQLARAEADRARRRLALLASVGPMLYSSLDYEETLERIARLAVPELADWCLVDILEEDDSVNQLAATHAVPEKEGLLRELQAHRRFGEDTPGTVARVLRTGQSVLVPEASESSLADRATSEEHLGLLRNLEVRSLMSVPLLARGRTLGAMTLVTSNPKSRYDEEDLSLAENLAYRCALAVDNARLYRERSHIARTLQRSLLPHLPEISEVEVGVEYLPVGEENEVGGDFYDLIEADGHWIAVIGDVCGKGAAAAAVTALTRYTIRAVAMQEDEPAAVLSVLNEAMIRQLEGSDQFCTVACARLKPATGSSFVLTVSRGGHPAPLVLRANGSVEAIDPPGKALGVFPDPDLGDRTVRLEVGDAALFYTDGVIEARGLNGSFFGEKRLRDFLRSCAGLEAPAIAEKLRDVVLEYGEGYPRDDLAVLVLRVPE